jgi:hypothetical protein
MGEKMKFKNEHDRFIVFQEVIYSKTINRADPTAITFLDKINECGKFNNFKSASKYIKQQIKELSYIQDIAYAMDISGEAYHGENMEFFIRDIKDDKVYYENQFFCDYKDFTNRIGKWEM